MNFSLFIPSLNEKHLDILRIFQFISYLGILFSFHGIVNIIAAPLFYRIVCTNFLAGRRAGRFTI